MTVPPLLQVRGLVKEFGSRRLLHRAPAVRVLDGVGFDLRAGETLGLVGESGSGKTTIGLILLRLLTATAGSIRFEGQELAGLGDRAFRSWRRRMQMIFQDPGGSLNQTASVGAILDETLHANRGDLSPAQRADMVTALLHQVGLDPAAASRYPQEFSGGQRQRIGIARALAARPALIVADEPVSALDVSVQAQILNLMMDLKAQLGLSYLFIAHDLAVVRRMSDHVAVLYRGRIVEQAPAGELFSTAAHPYTRLLLAAVPRADPRLPRPSGTGVSAAHAATRGCAFAPRCAYRVARCFTEVPALRTIAPDRRAACHLV